MYIEVSQRANGQFAYITSKASYPSDNTDRYVLFLSAFSVSYAGTNFTAWCSGDGATVENIPPPHEIIPPMFWLGQYATVVDLFI